MNRMTGGIGLVHAHVFGSARRRHLVDGRCGCEFCRGWRCSGSFGLVLECFLAAVEAEKDEREDSNQGGETSHNPSSNSTDISLALS
jgi:hypothetical protein